MRVLIEIVHPADVLFFFRPMQMFAARGDKLLVLSRKKDVTVELLDAFGIVHEPITRKGRGLLGLGLEMLVRDAKLFRRARAFGPDIMLGFGGVSISHVSKLLGRPSLAFYDSDTATLQTRLAYPFLTHLVVPEDYAGTVPKGRVTRLKGTKDLSYFYPDFFTPDRDVAIIEGLDPDRRNIFVRLVEWGATHDIGKQGWSNDEIAAFLEGLVRRCKLHVSVEGDVPEALRPHLWRGDPSRVHHLLGHCDAYVGESASMACEAITMGVPAIYAGMDFLGYTKGLAERGLLELVAPPDRVQMAERTLALLEDDRAFQTARTAWIAECPDWAEQVVAMSDRIVAGGRP